MNRENIFGMAQRAGGDDWGLFREFMPEIERFADLVEAAVRESIQYDIHSCHQGCENPACVAVRKAVAAERAACVEDARTLGGDFGVEMEKLIRARGGNG